MDRRCGRDEGGKEEGSQRSFIVEGRALCGQILTAAHAAVDLKVQGFGLLLGSERNRKTKGKQVRDAHTDIQHRGRTTTVGISGTFQNIFTTAPFFLKKNKKNLYWYTPRIKTYTLLCKKFFFFSFPEMIITM